MKTISQIKSEVEELRKILKNDESTIKECNAAEKKIKMRNKCILYLETNPREGLIEQEYDKLKFKIERIKELFLEYCKNNHKSPTDKEAISEWSAMNNLAYLKRELAMLKYLID